MKHSQFGLLSILTTGIIASNPAQAAINEGLIAHYAFESSGNLGLDSSGNGNHLRSVGNSEAGIKGNGLALDGFSSLDAADSAPFSTTSDFTWSVWFQVEDDLAGAIISKSPDGWLPGSKALFKGEESFLGFDVSWVGAAEFEGEIQDGQWHHAVVVATFPEDEPIGIFELYVDGSWVSEVEADAEEASEPDEAIFRVGGGSPGGFDPEVDGEQFPEPDTFFGNLDEVRIYDRALEPEEITELLIDGLGELPPPAVTSQPFSQQVVSGRPLTLSVGANGLLLDYEWFKDGNVVEEATEPTLTISEVGPDAAGEYNVVVSNSSGSVSSDIATITVLDDWAPSIGLAGHWDFETSGNPGKDASGNGVDLEDIGVFSSEGSKGMGIETGFDAFLVDSDELLQLNTHTDFTWAAMIKSEDQGNIVSQSNENWSPGNKGLFVREGILGLDVGWIGAAGGGPDLTDGAWHHVAVVNQGQDGETVQRLFVDGNLVDETDLPVLDQPNSGIFAIGYGSDDFPELEELGDQDTPNYVGFIDEVRVYRSGLIQDDIITLMLDAGGQAHPPAISEQPIDITVTAGRTARISVTATGTAPMFQWLKDGVALEDTNSPTLIIGNVSDTDAGEYSVIVSSEFSDDSATSDVASLSVEPAPQFGAGELAHVAPFLESYWTFDGEADGIISDLSPNAPKHDGMLTGGAELTSGGQGFGGTGEALDTSLEENAHMAAMNPEAYDFNSSFTWSAWIKLFDFAAEGDEAGSGIFGRAPAESEHSPGSKILYLNGDTLGFDTGWVGAVNSEEPNLSLDSWHHVAMTHNAEDEVVSIFLDGEPVIFNETDEPAVDVEFFVGEFPEDEADDGEPVNSAFRVGDGAIGFFGDAFPGVIDNAAVWSVALTPDDIASLASGASPLPEVLPSNPINPPLPPVSGGGDPLSLEFERDGNTLTIIFSGNLYSADSVDSSYELIDEAVSPMTVDLGSLSGTRFYLVR